MARKVILYISVSLDGYIADQYGSVSQLVGKSEEYSGDYGYEEFISGTDTILMGMNTFTRYLALPDSEKLCLYPQGNG